MALEPFSTFMEYLIKDLRAHDTTVTDPQNIVIGESMSLIDKPDSFFPRLEILITKQKYNGWIDQRNLEQAFRFSIAGHFRRDQDDVTESDMYKILDWGQSLITLIYRMHDVSVSSGQDAITPGFIQVSGYPEIFAEYELFPRISTTILIAEIEIQLRDTFTTN
jgi:hypothetical protein